LERFVPIFEALSVRMPNALLLIIADPHQTLVTAARECAQERGLADRIIFLPVIRPLERFLATVALVDLWVATLGDDTVQGRQEFRMELVEVGMLGGAVVAAPTPGLLAHGLKDGDQVVYIDPAHPKLAAEKLVALASHPQLLKRLGSRLREHVERQFSVHHAVDEVLASAGHRGPDDHAVTATGSASRSRG